MPELPEVETIVRGLRPYLTGRTVRNVEVAAPLVVKTSLEGSIGRAIISVSRLGKNVILAMGDGVLSVHLGMTGKLLVNGGVTPYTRVIFFLDGLELVYDDIRQFGRIHYAPKLPEHLTLLGPDPLEISPGDFTALLRLRSRRIKPLLLDQHVLGGLGNIYVDEALFRAGIHPRALSNGLSKGRVGRLHEAIRNTLLEAIEHGGSSISDYVDASGNKGSFQQKHAVYGREGQPCLTCGTPIRRIVLTQRGTHFCPKCQRQ